MMASDIIPFHISGTVHRGVEPANEKLALGRVSVITAVRRGPIVVDDFDGDLGVDCTHHLNVGRRVHRLVVVSASDAADVRRRTIDDVAASKRRQQYPATAARELTIKNQLDDLRPVLSISQHTHTHTHTAVQTVSGTDVKNAFAFFLLLSR